jgi:hypothetical protein
MSEGTPVLPGTGVAPAPPPAAGVGDGPAVIPAHALGGGVIVFVSRVTAPFRASARPIIVAPVVIVMLVRAMTLPWKLVVVPNVAELPTCQ